MLLAVIALLALVAAACSGGAETASASEASTAVIAAATQNQSKLVLGDELSESQLLDTRTGAITSLGDVVTGDRAVLLWYWAPS